MPAGLRSIHSSRASRAIYILTVLLVFSYIFFDVLDLDGSNFPRLLMRMERAVIVAVVPSGALLNHSSEHSKLRDDIPLLFADRSGLNVPPSWAEALSPSALDTARSHRYRVGLARNSLPD